MPSSTRRNRRVLAVIVAAGIGFTLASPAGADTRAERERVRQQQAEVASQINVLQATNAEVEQALNALNANVAGQEAALADAQRAAAEAEAAAEAARQREAATQAEMQARRDELRNIAVEAYIRHGTGDVGMVLLQSEDISEGVQRQALVTLRSGQYGDLIDELRALAEDLEIARQEAEAASAAAEQHRSEVQDRLAEVEAARDQQAVVAAEVDARIEHALAESAALADLDAQLSRQIAEEQARLAALAAQRARQSGGGGGTSAPRVVGNVSLTTVRGITVASSIADQLEAMLAAAEADGIVLRGGGYRSSESQIALRRAHCGSSDYAVYQMPPSQCRPPTARPGQSNHERGMAVDFTYNGRVISSRSSPAFQWLNANANRYGFYNLPSEPWHWSVDGN